MENSILIIGSFVTGFLFCWVFTVWQLQVSKGMLRNLEALISLHTEELVRATGKPAIRLPEKQHSHIITDEDEARIEGL